VEAADQEALASARLWAVTSQPYLAAALFAMTPVTDHGTGTFATDRHWRLYVDPECFSKWTTQEIGAVLVHEAHHLLRDHANRARSLGVTIAEARRFNVAADLEINDDLGELPLPSGGCFPAGFGMEPGLLAEEYFAALSPQVAVPWGDCGSGAHGVTGERELAADLGPDATAGLDVAEGDLIRQQIAEEVRRRSNAGESLGAGLERWATTFLTPTIDWRRLLAAAVRGGVALASGSVDYSYSRPSRRQTSPASRGVVLPSMVRPVPEVAVVVDTSGSMGSDDLGRALAEVSGVLKECGVMGRHVAVLSCDDSVRTTQRVFTSSAVRLVGGGGTDMGIALAAAENLRPRPQLVVVLTDGMTPWPNKKPAIDRVVVGLIGRVHGDAPLWAQVVEIAG
jgi:predicted metal-dependent peptidase